MTQIVSSISGIEIWAPSAGSASKAMYDKNNRDLSKCVDSQSASAIASAYQVVSATATQLYAGTAYLTEVNGTPISAARAGNAANASMANSAYYDGTGRLISSLPDSATVSSIASSYAESAVSSKADSSALSSYALSADVSGCIDTVSSNSASWGGGGAAFPAEIKTGTTLKAVVTTGFQDNTATRPTLFISSNPSQTQAYPRMMLSENHTNTSQGKSAAFLADAFEFYTGNGSKVFRANRTSVSAAGQFDLESALVSGGNAGNGSTASRWFLNRNGVSGKTGTSTWQYTTAEYGMLTSVHDTVSANSASWGGGGGVVTSTASASAGDPLIPIYYVNKINGSGLYAVSAEESEFAQYDTNGRLLLEIPGSAEVSAIASAYSESAASLPITGAQGDYSASHGISSVDFTYGEDGGASNLYTGSINVSSIEIDYTPDNEEFYSTQLTHNYLNFTGPNHNQSMGPSEIEYWNDVATTVSTESGNWGGVDEATVSSIASSYAESSVSSKADSSALSSYALSADVSGVIDTVSANSASWGQGGVDSATVSAIASSYADNCWPLSSTTINSTARDINVRWGNDRIVIGKESNRAAPHIEMGVGGFPSKSAGLESTRVFGGALGNPTYRSWSLDISGVRATGGVGDGVWQYGSAEYGQLTGVYDTVSSNSASWGAGGDVYISGFGYNDTDISAIEGSALYDKSAHSRITTVAGRVTNLSAAVSGTVDLVSTQSANWGGSALALSAGPGVKLEKVGTTIVASTDETVLYSATAYAPGDTQQSYSLIETPMNFETVRVLAYRPLANGAPWFGSVDIQIANLYNYTAVNTLMAMPYAFVGTANNIFYEGQYFINNITSTSWEDGSSTQRKTTETAYTTGYYAHIYKIIGINRTAGV